MGKLVMIVSDELRDDTAAEQMGHLEHLVETKRASRYTVVAELPTMSRPLYERLQTGLGVTARSAQGMFTESQHTVLFCTVNRPDVNALKGAVRGVDPQAFVVIGHGHQSSGGVVPRARAKSAPMDPAATE